MYTLYYALGTCALASHVALEDAGADYQAVRLEFKNNEQRKPEYLKLNPKGRVPSLVTPSGVLTETPAILAYIAQSFPAAGLMPLDDPFRFAQAQSFNSFLCSTVHVAHAHRMRGYRWTDDADAIKALQQKVPDNMSECFGLIEREMFAGPWVLGDRYSVCDPYLFTLAGWLDGDGVDIARFPKVADHFRRVSERPAVQKVQAQQKAAS